MNRIDFTQTGGFPLDQDVLGFQQVNINTVMQTASVFGQLAIISGCTVVGSTATNGYVVINGEVLPFEGGVIEEKVRIVETSTNLNYEDGVDRPSQINRVARFGDDGVTAFIWANFKRNTNEGVLARLDRVEWLLRPLIMQGKTWWAGTKDTIPAGWREVEDWRGKLPMHWNPADPDFNVVGKTGGAKDVTMKLENLIEHDHPTKRVRTDNIGDLYEPNSLKSDDERGLHEGNDVTTGKAGSAVPIPLKTLNPYVTGMWIEPIPNFIPGTF